MKSFARYAFVGGKGTHRHAELAWALVGSHNCSRAAWGSLYTVSDMLVVIPTLHTNFHTYMSLSRRWRCQWCSACVTVLVSAILSWRLPRCLLAASTPCAALQYITKQKSKSKAKSKSKSRSKSRSKASCSDEGTDYTCCSPSSFELSVLLCPSHFPNKRLLR